MAEELNRIAAAWIIINGSGKLAFVHFFEETRGEFP